MEIKFHVETEVAIATVVLWVALNIISDAIWDNKYVSHIQVLACACIVIAVFILGSVFYNYKNGVGKV
jgi:hypothetical protein